MGCYGLLDNNLRRFPDLAFLVSARTAPVLALDPF